MAAKETPHLFQLLGSAVAELKSTNNASHEAAAAAAVPPQLACSSSSGVQWLKVDQKRARIMPSHVALGSSAL